MEHLAQHEAFGWEKVLQMFQDVCSWPNLASSGSGCVGVSANDSNAIPKV
jgi:hypothetical protein